MTRARLWFYILFPLCCFYVFAYPVIRLGAWLYGGGVGIVGATAIWLLGVAGMYYAFSGPKMKVRYIVVHWMGAGFIFASVVAAGELVRLLAPVSDRALAQGCLVTGLALTLGAIAFSHLLAVKRHRIVSDKVKRPLRIVQLSDVHIGSRQKGFMDRIVHKVQSLAPDCLVITGDLIDSSAVEQEALSALAELSMPVYFSIGNHERYADLPKIIDIARRLGMKILRQDTDFMGDIEFIGIDDADRPEQVSLELPNIAFDKSKFCVLLYHRPLGWESAMEQGIDLMLSGHTHNGQIFPFNWIVRQQFPRIAGMHRQGDQYLYVSSGTGTWGPLMRLGSRNEISVFDIEPASGD